MGRSATSVAALALLAAIATLHAAPKTPAQVSCSVQLRDADGDVLRSDGAGSYVDGVAGASCQIDKFTHWLSLSFASRSRRYLIIAGQTNSEGAYSAISRGVTLDIKAILDTQPPLDVMSYRIRISSPQFLDSFGQFTGDSSYDAGAAIVGTSSLFLATIDACTWQATSYTTGVALRTLAKGENAGTQTDPRVALLTEAGIPGTSQAVTRGHFSTPFAATIRIIAGKPGCPL